MTTNGWPEGLRRTKPRESIYRILRDAEMPLSVAEIAARLEGDGTRWYSTIYRTMQAFMDHDLVQETTAAGTDVRLYELKGEKHHHYVTCVICHKMEPLAYCPMDEILAHVEGFDILDHRLEISGICEDCRLKHQKGTDSLD